jgi:hypothetical protein
MEMDVGRMTEVSHKHSKIEIAACAFAAAVVAIFTAQQAGARTVNSLSRQVVTQTPPPATVCKNCIQPFVESDPVPTAGYNPITATDARLDRYGFPPRPRSA